MARLFVDIVPATRMLNAVCPVCSTGFDLAVPAAVLYYEDRPLGYLCERCLRMGPTGAAPEVRERASNLRASIPTLPSAVWAGVVQALRERADFWERLADEFDRVGWWVLRQQESAVPKR